MYMCICIFYHFSFLFRRVSWTYRAVGLAVARVASVQPGAAARASPGALTASLALTRLLQTLMMEPLGSALLQWGTHGSAREDRLEGHSVVSELGSAPLFKNTGTWGFAAVFSCHSVKVWGSAGGLESAGNSALFTVQCSFQRPDVHRQELHRIYFCYFTFSFIAHKIKKNL